MNVNDGEIIEDVDGLEDQSQRGMYVCMYGMYGLQKG